jgi:hypothetical protein
MHHTQDLCCLLDLSLQCLVDALVHVFAHVVEDLNRLLRVSISLR